MTDFNLES